MTALRQTLEAARQALILMRSNRLVWLIAAAALGAILLAVAMPDRVVRRFTGDDVFGFSSYLLMFQFGMPTVISYLGLWVVHDEISDRSVVHVFAQPVPRTSLLVGKWLAVAVLGAVAVALVCAGYWLALAAGDRPWRRGLGPDPATLAAFIACGALASPGYAAVGAFCGATFKRPLIAAVIFVVGWEVAVSNVPPNAGVRGWTIADPVRRQLVDMVDPPAGSQLARVLQHSLGGQDTSDLGDPLSSVAWFTAVVLTAAIAVYCRREYDARARD